MRPVLGYALVGAAVLAAVSAGLGQVLDPASARAVWRMAGVAYVVQVAAFAALWAGRRGRAFFAAWTGGTLVRLGLLLGVAVWLLRTASPAVVATLASLAGFLFFLLLLEPFFFRVGLRGL